MNVYSSPANTGQFSVWALLSGLLSPLTFDQMGCLTLHGRAVPVHVC